MMFPVKLDRWFMHPDALFGAVRMHDVHTGVDIYCDEGREVFAMERGEVIAVGQFTGKAVDSPWWNDTHYVAVKGKSGIIVYGEIEPEPWLAPGRLVFERDFLGRVMTVLKKDKGRPMSMLHLELYDPRAPEFPAIWIRYDPMPAGLLDPIQMLSDAWCETRW